MLRQTPSVQAKVSRSNFTCNSLALSKQSRRFNSLFAQADLAQAELKNNAAQMLIQNMEDYHNLLFMTSTMKVSPHAQQRLLHWFLDSAAELPWRASRDAYRIWISEVMLQQTTTTAVIPFFERFLEQFPDLNALAEAQVGDVLAAWSGLGYYSRARNLHRAALKLRKYSQIHGSFPQTHVELAQIPGFGPYTARAVSSLAFDEAVGVVDGNVIRVLTRYFDLAWEWWKPSARPKLQELADAWVNGFSSRNMNQGLMELGRRVCTPQSPHCALCPLARDCRSRISENWADRPLKRPRRPREIWIWQPVIDLQRGRVALTETHSLPFLRRQWVLPGEARKVSRPPSQFDFKHTITHHDIYVLAISRRLSDKGLVLKRVKLEEISRYAPASLVRKALSDVQPVGGVLKRPQKSRARS